VSIQTMSNGAYTQWRREQDKARREWDEANAFGYKCAFTDCGLALEWRGDGKLHLVEVSGEA